PRQKRAGDASENSWGEVMKRIVFAVLVAGSIVGAAAAAWADADDAKWVAQCIKDNQDATVSVEVVTKYCTCMNNKMSSSETQSITQWEKSHPPERVACD